MTYYATPADVAGIDPAACTNTPCDAQGVPLAGFGFYGYAPLPNGMMKCQGFQDSLGDWFTPAMKGAYPDVVVVLGYKGAVCSKGELLGAAS